MDRVIKVVITRDPNRPKRIAYLFSTDLRLFVMPTPALPATKTISLSTLMRSAARCSSAELRAGVEAACRVALSREGSSSSGAAA